MPDALHLLCLKSHIVQFAGDQLQDCEMGEHRNIETIGWVVHNAKEDFKLEELILDGPQDDELLVDMKFSGICHTVN